MATTSTAREVTRKPRRLVLPSGAGLIALIAAGSAAEAGGRDPMRDLLMRAEQDYRRGSANDLIERLRPLSGAGQPTGKSAEKPPAAPRAPDYPPPVYLSPVRVAIVAGAQTAADIARPVQEPRAIAAGLGTTKLARIPAAAQAQLKSITPRLTVVVAREVELPPPRVAPPITSDPAVSAPARGPPPVAGDAAIPRPAEETHPPRAATVAPPAPAPTPGASPHAAPETRKPTAAQCRDILERAQLGVVSASEIAVLRAHCR